MNFTRSRRVRARVTGRPRVLVVASHPIQYQSPWFRALAAVTEIDFSVCYIHQPDPIEQGRGFGIAFNWDIPLLEDFRSQQASGVQFRTGAHGFFLARLRTPSTLVNDADPDVLLITGWHIWPLVQVLIAGWRAGIPIVMRGESNALRTRPIFVSALHRLLLSRCAAFLPIGKASRDFYRGYGIADAKLFDAPYFVDNHRFVESARRLLPTRDELRSRWNIPSDTVCYCYAGKFEPKKRILDLLDALHLAVQRSPRPLHLLVVGAGELKDQAQAITARWNLPVTFAGFLNQSEIPSAYVAADCLVLPSDYGETWGLVVNEAMACGRPAIVSDRVGCAPDLVTLGVTGAAYPCGNVEALAQCLVDHADPQKLRDLGEQARQRVLTGYSVEKSVAGTMDAIRYVLGTP